MSQKPLALLVEDSDAQREERAEALRDIGFSVIQARDGVSALAQLRNSPKPDLVVSDVNLVQNVSSDRSGRDFAKIVSREMAGTIVVVYSANDGLQDSLRPSDDDEGRIEFVSKAQLDDFEDVIRRHYEASLENQTERWDRVGQNAASETSFSSPSEESADVSLLRDFEPYAEARIFPGWHSQGSPERVLKDAGFTLKVVDGSIYSDITDAYRPRNVHFPFLVWLRSNDDNVYAELYKFPEIAAYARNEEDATKQILREMRRARKNLGARKRPIKEHQEQLKTFLDRVLGP